MFSRAFMIGGACLAVALSGCSLTPTSSSGTAGFTGAKALVASTLNLLSTDGSSGNGADICKNVLSTTQRKSLNAIGNCTTIIDNQLKTIDTFTVTIKSITVTGATATARVQTELNGNKVVTSVALKNETDGWRLDSIGSL